ncbi:hypothetical protein ACU4GD_25085 [Cupriavidus basilensis]
MHAQHFVANRLIAPDSGMRIKVFDPSSGEPFAEIARGNLVGIDVAVHATPARPPKAPGAPWRPPSAHACSTAWR